MGSISEFGAENSSSNLLIGFIKKLKNYGNISIQT
jgi:hypothetical protein